MDTKQKLNPAETSSICAGKETASDLSRQDSGPQVQQLETLEGGRPISTLRTQRSSEEFLEEMEDKELFSSAYVPPIQRFAGHKHFRNMMSVHAPFQLPRLPEKIMECVHDCPPTAIPQPPPPDVSDHESDSEVQRFIFSILTQRKIQSWQGMHLAMNHAFQIGAFCEAFRPTAARLNEARTREALYKSSSIAPALQIMFFDIIWAKICELRPDTEQLVEAHARLEDSSFCCGYGTPPAAAEALSESHASDGRSSMKVKISRTKTLKYPKSALQTMGKKFRASTTNLFHNPSAAARSSM